MTTNNRLILLIEAAGHKAGSYYKLAKQIGFTESDISSWKANRKPCPIEAQALMADVAGLKAEEVALLAIIERAAEKNPRRGEMLERALGKTFERMSAGASCAISGSLILVSKLLDNTMYITSRQRIRYRNC